MKFFNNILKFVDRLSSYYYDGLNGTALPPDSLVYVERDIDSQVYQFIRSEDDLKIACYIFGATQVGKSSLALRLIKLLEREDNICVLVSVKALQHPLTMRSFYSGFINEVCQRVRKENEQFSFDSEADWDIKHNSNLLVSKLENLLITVLQKFAHRKIRIFIDDIQELDFACFQDLLELLKRLENISTKNIVFIMFGNIYPVSFLLTSQQHSIIIKTFQIEPLSGECRSLQNGMTSIIKKPATLIRELLKWTGGQPLLTLFLSHLSARSFIKEGKDIKILVDNLVQRKIFDSWNSNFLLIRHSNKIINYFIRGDPQLKSVKFYALEQYRLLLDTSRNCSYTERSLTQRALIESGLAINSDGLITVANPIYRKVFNDQWVNSIQQSICSGENKMAKPNYKISNRDFFFLIDTSGSMKSPVSSKKPKQRFESIKEAVKGHIRDVISNLDDEGNKICDCDEVTIAFFNVDIQSKRIYGIIDPQTVEEKFQNTNPAGDTYIAPTFKHLMRQWLATRGSRDGAVVIYVDGLVDDRANFVSEIRNVCRELQHYSHLTILIVGIGDAINSETTMEWYFNLDLNGPNFRDANNEPCNVVIFNRMDDVNVIGGIIPAIEAQLIPDPNAGLPEWLQEQFPDLYEKLKQKYNIP